MSRKIGIGCLALLLTIYASGSTRGDLVVSIASPTVSVGGTGSVEVDLTNAGSSSVSINNYSIQLLITPTTGTLTQLAFTPPTDAQLGYLTDTTAVTPYVFLNNSSDAAVPPPFIGGPAQTVTNNDTFNAIDSTADSNPVTIGAGQTYLLAVLPITTLTQLDPQAGDSFTVSLVSGSGDGSINGGSSTYFDYFDFDPNSPTAGTELSATPYSSTPGTVMVSAATAVPEPSSVALLGLGLAGLTAFARRRSL